MNIGDVKLFKKVKTKAATLVGERFRCYPDPKNDGAGGGLSNHTDANGVTEVLVHWTPYFVQASTNLERAKFVLPDGVEFVG